jgi:biotin carboxyl carrier protein
MKFNVTINNRQRQVELARNSATLIATVDDAAHEITIHDSPTRRTAADGQTYLVSLANRIYECRVAGTGEMEITVGNEVYHAHVTDPRALPTGAAAADAAGGRVRLTASMPGKIVRVMTEQGAQVEAGESLVVVEAMKMQNEMKAPKSGTVVELRAEAGATVQAGDVLVVVE